MKASFEFKDSLPATYNKEGLTREFFRAYQDCRISGDNSVSDIERLTRQTEVIDMFYALNRTEAVEFLPFFDITKGVQAKIEFSESEQNTGYLAIRKQEGTAGILRVSTEQFEAGEVIALLQLLAPTKNRGYRVRVEWKTAEEEQTEKEIDEDLKNVRETLERMRKPVVPGSCDDVGFGEDEPDVAEHNASQEEMT